jgi:hypothetical protein
MIEIEEKEIARYFDRFLNCPTPVPDSDVLRCRGEALRQRLHIET